MRDDEPRVDLGKSLRDPSAGRGRGGRLTLGLAALGAAPLIAPLWPTWISEVALSSAFLVALGLLVAALWAAVQRRVRRAVLATVLATANGLMIVSAIGWPAGDGVGCAHPLRMVSVNALYNNRSPPVLDEYLRTQGFDVVFLQETNSHRRWKEFREGLRAVYPHQVTSGRDVAILSRLPFVGGAFPDGMAPDLGSPFLAGATVPAVVEVGGRDVVLVSAHLSSPQTQGLFKQRNRQMDLLGAALARESRPVILGGDLNVVPWSPRTRAVLSMAGLGALPYGGWPVATRPNWLPYMGVQIDYVLPTATAFRGVQRVGPDVGSDHLPVEADLCPVATAGS